MMMDRGKSRVDREPSCALGQSKCEGLNHLWTLVALYAYSNYRDPIIIFMSTTLIEEACGIGVLHYFAEPRAGYVRERLLKRH